MDKKNKKKIIDSVHGNVFIDSAYVSNIIDTPEFQRLRRIEQTSVRAIFPSARHDRFIHSIGVYYLGCLFVDQIIRDVNSWKEDHASIYEALQLTKEDYERITESYKIACLVHDIGHAPFSHSLEEYYGDKSGELKKDIEENIPNFTLSKKAINNAKHHELASIYVAAKTAAIRSFIDAHADMELIGRMIIGYEYEDDTTYHQICNCFISLLNGKVIDADRLDYACRDVWASGYCTSTVDVKRLISGLHLTKEGNKYIICFDGNVLNEITSVITVKDFQVKYVINHHTVKYEQELLERGVECTASVLYDREDKGSIESELLYSRFINYKAIPDEYLFSDRYRTTRVADDDIVFLMKQCPQNPHYDEWASRQYKKFALWKTVDEFYSIFEDIPRDVAIDNTKIEDQLKQLLHDKYALNKDSDILILPVEFKARVKLNELNIKVKNKILPYEKLYRGLLGEEPEKIFMFVFVSKQERKPEAIEAFRQDILQSIKQLIIQTYRPSSLKGLISGFAAGCAQRLNHFSTWLKQ